MPEAPFKLLIIDDEERIRELLTDYLEDFEEFNLRACESGEAALELLDAEPAELCIVDIRLPGMDGQSFVLAALARGLCQRFILHTGSTDFVISDELRARGLGEDDVFHKPCDMSAMLERIQKKLKPAGA